MSSALCNLGSCSHQLPLVSGQITSSEKESVTIRKPRNWDHGWKTVGSGGSSTLLSPSLPRSLMVSLSASPLLTSGCLPPLSQRFHFRTLACAQSGWLLRAQIYFQAFSFNSH